MKNISQLICDPEEGVCALPYLTTTVAPSVVGKAEKPVTIFYFTDPICSSCWGIEPQLRKLQLEYGPIIDVRYYMGGLLPDWTYNSGGISKPSDVARHWDEVSLRYEMPIDGDLWLEDPLHSSYPPSIAFKAAQAQGTAKAALFLRRLREMVFLEKKNIAKLNHLLAAAEDVGLDVTQLQKDFEGPAAGWFQADLAFARSKSVRGFPSFFATNANGREAFVYGVKPYAVFEAAIHTVHPEAQKEGYSKSWNDLFSRYSSLTTKEFTELGGLPFLQAHTLLEQLEKEERLKRVQTKNGCLWRLQ